MTEYLSHDPIKAHPESPRGSFRLPVKPEPTVLWETDLAKWICANEHGATFGDNTDDTAALQRAIDAAAAAGATTVYLRGIGGGDPNWYTLNGEVRVHGSVRHLLGLGFGRIIAGPAGRFLVDDGSAPVVKFQHLQAFGGRAVRIENRSAASTLVVESCDAAILGTGSGDIFVTDCPSGIELRSPTQSLWARQLNPEGSSDTGLVRNHGARLWVLGVKHEGAGVRFRCDNGGQTEVFGMFNYGPGLSADDRRPMLDIDNSPFSLMGVREIHFGGNAWPVKVREVRDSQERRIEGGGWIGWAQYSGWAPGQADGPRFVARPTLLPAGDEFLDSVTVTAATTTPGATLHYTTDGSEPTEASPVLAAPLVLTASTTLKVRGVAPERRPSAIAEAVYTRLDLRPAEQVFRPAAGLECHAYELPEGSNRVPDLAGLTPVAVRTVTAIDTVPRPRDQGYALRYAGWFVASAAGLYRFRVTSDDGSRLWIGDRLVVDNDGPHAAQERSGRIALAAGQHPIAVGYYQGAGDAELRVEVEGPGLPRRPVAGALVTALPGTSPAAGAVPGVEYAYYEGSWTRLPDFDAFTPTGTGTIEAFSLAPRHRDEHYALRFRGWIRLPADGPWAFHTTSDDGSRLLLDGVEIVNNDAVQAATRRSGTVFAGAGHHAIEVTYFQGNGGSHLEVAFEGPGLPAQPIPATALFRTGPGKAP